MTDVKILIPNDKLMRVLVNEVDIPGVVDFDVSTSVPQKPTVTLKILADKVVITDED